MLNSKLKGEVAKVAAWEFDRWIPCHGVCPYTTHVETMFIFKVLSLGRCRDERKAALQESI